MADREDKVILDFGANRVTVTEDRFTIGRGEECDLTIDDDAQVSRVHVEVLRNADGGFDVRDAGSTNGIFVNEQQAGSDAVTLRSGDTVRFGRTTFTVVIPGAPTRLGGGGETRMAQPQSVSLVGIDGVGKGREIKLGDEPVTVGRDQGCDLAIEDEELSRRHARLRLRGDGTVEVEDLDSRNGVFAAGSRISGTASARLGDEIKLGATTFSIGSPRRTKMAAPAAVAGAGTAAGGGAAERDQSEKRSLPVAAIIGGVVLVLVIAAGALALGGVFSGDDEEAADEPLTTQELITEAKPSTVLVKVYVGQQDVGNGSGWVYDAEEGLIVTNAHVVDFGERFKVGVDGDPDLRSATVVASAPCDDLAVLRVRSTEGLRTMPLGSQADLVQGDKAIVLGYPGNATTEDELQVTEGVVSAVGASFDEPVQADPDFQVYPNTVQYDTATNGGNSGGPSINDAGELIGTHTLGGGGQGQNFSIGVDRVKELVPQLAAGESLGWAGFGFQAALPEEAAEAGRGFLRVTTVVPGTGAAENEVFPDDLILELNGQQVETRTDYCNAVENVSAGEPIKIAGVYSEGEYTLRVPFE